MSLHITFTCVLHHRPICRGQEGKKNCHDFILPELWFRQCRSECQSLTQDPGQAMYVCPGWSSPAQQQQLVLYYRLFMSCCLHRAQTCLCHSFGRSRAPNTSTCTATGWDIQGIQPGAGQEVQGAANSQPITCTKITAAETSSFHNRHPHTLSPFYLGFAHGFRIRICW